MPTMEDSAHDYEEATDGCRLVRATSDNARQGQQVKPDPDVNPLAELDYEEGRRGIGTCRMLLLCERVCALDRDRPKVFRSSFFFGRGSVSLVIPYQLRNEVRPPP